MTNFDYDDEAIKWTNFDYGLEVEHKAHEGESINPTLVVFSILI